MMQATTKPKEAVEYAWEIETKNCIWSVNSGFDPEAHAMVDRQQRGERRHRADKKPTVEQVANMKLAEEAVELAGGRGQDRKMYGVTTSW